MIKNILAISLFILSLTVPALAKDKIFQHSSSTAPVIKGHVAYLFHPQMIDSRSGIPFDISGRSNLAGTCMAFNFDHGAVGADLFYDQAFEAVVINRSGDVVSIENGVATIQMLKCSAY